MPSYAYTQSRIFQWIGILLAIGIIATGYYYFRASAGVKTNTLMPSGSLTSGLVGYWPFDRASVAGTTAQDRSTNKFNGTLSGGPSIVAGTIHEAIDLDGTDDLVSMGDQASLDVGDTGDFSVSGWFSRDTFTTDDVIVAKVNGTGSGETGYVVYIDDATDQLILKVGDGVDTYFIASTTTFTSATWVHFVVVWDQDSASGTTMYLNGAAASNGASGTIGNINDLSNALAFHVGQTQAGSDYFDGKLDEIRFYNRVLTASEVTTLYDYKGKGGALNSSASQPQGTGRLDSGLAGYWKLDDGSGTSAADTSTNGNTGTLTNGPTWTTGQVGGAVNFDGSNDYVDIGINKISPRVNGASAITLSAWLKPSAYPAAATRARGVSFNTTNAATGGLLGLYDGGKLEIGGRSVSTDAFQSATVTFPALNEWHFATGILDFPNDKIYVYLDGVLQVTQSVTFANTSYTNGTPTTALDAIGSSGSLVEFFSGSIDEPHIYNRALSESEVSDLYRLTSPTGVDTSLKGYWSFNGPDMNGTTAYDRSGSGLSGTLTSGPTVTKGRVGQALDFDGTDDYVTITDTDDTKYTGAITLCTWAKIDTGSAYRHFMGKHASNGATQNPFDFRTTSDTIPLLVFVRANSDSKNWTGPAVTLGAWKHYCVTAPSAIESAPTFYIDGVAAVTPTAGGTGTGTATGSGAAIRIGVRSDSAVRMDGSMDEVRIYNRALSAAEIQSLYNQSNPDPINSSASQPQGTGRLDSGLAGYWKLDDGSGTSATDSSTNGNTGTLTNGPTWTTGQVGGALDFDGSNDYVTMGDQSVHEGMAAMSLAGWIKMDNLPAANYFVISKSSGIGQYRLAISSAGIPTFVVATNNNAWYSAGTTANGATALTTSTWIHLLGTYDGQYVRLYVNGVLAGTGSQAISGAIVSNTSEFRLSYDTYGNYFNGQIDEVRIYNRALSESEVSDLYRLTSPTGVDTSLKGYWSFNGPDMNGTTAYDRSGAGNNGTLTNGPTRTIGKIGQALRFDGADDYVDAGSASSLDNITQMTMTAWIKPNSLGENGSGRIIDKDGTSFAGRMLYVCSSGTCGVNNSLRFARGFGTTDGTWTTTADAVSMGVWQFVAITYDDSSVSNDPVFYVNGSVVSSSENSTPVGSAETTEASYNWVIGNRPAGDRSFDGSIDEVRVYNRILSVNEITALYNQGR